MDTTCATPLPTGFSNNLHQLESYNQSIAKTNMYILFNDFALWVFYLDNIDFDETQSK